eukprot:2567361-Pyramimonas_sp.AAC.1
MIGVMSNAAIRSRCPCGHRVISNHLASAVLAGSLGYDVDAKGYDVDIKGYDAETPVYSADVCKMIMAYGKKDGPEAS